MSDLKFTQDHEWIRPQADGQGTVGITDYAQQQLGDVVFVELPEIGAAVKQHEEAAVVESVKAASEVKSPVSGKVVAINVVLAEEPQKVNESPCGEGWFFRVQLSDPAELNGLMSESAYADYLKTLA